MLLPWLHVVVGKVNTPDHLHEDWISRTKVAINLKQNLNWPYPSNSRFFYHLVNNSLLLTEKCAEKCDLDPYVLHEPAVSFVHRIQELVEEVTSEIAANFIERFKTERPMQSLMSELLSKTVQHNVAEY